jgi:hypothetical protein
MSHPVGTKHLTGQNAATWRGSIDVFRVGDLLPGAECNLEPPALYLAPGVEVLGELPRQAAERQLH